MPILTLPPASQLKLVNGDFVESLQDCIIDTGADQMLLQGSVQPPPAYHIRRLGTVMAPKLSETLFLDGVDGLLDIQYQLKLGEPPLPVTGLSHVDGDLSGGTVDYTGPYGVYYREIFFHNPY